MEVERAKSAALSEVNRNILVAARQSISEEQEWEFFCECGLSECDARVKLTIAAYSLLHDRGGAVLASGHTMSRLERAKQLGDDAESLRSQAQLQVEPAKKNRQR